MKHVNKYSFLIFYCLVPLPYIGFRLGGWLTFLIFLLLFTLVPLIDAFIVDSYNANHSQEKILVKNSFYKLIIYAYVPIQLILVGSGIYLVSNYELKWYEWLGFTMSTGLLTGGAGINLAHEMMHKRSRLQHFFSKVLLTSICYGHFFIEHVKGHHVRVATPEDPATAQLGESLYHFIPKTVGGSFVSAWQLERKRLEKNKYPIWSRHNQFWVFLLVPLTIATIAFLYGGLNALLFFILQSIFGFINLEIVNYIEHYGLERKKLPNGMYEKVTPLHAWNANHWISNMILFHLQRHSDHHTYSARPYQILRHMEQSPQLPSGYLGMMVLALIPPLWRAVMDKKVLAYRKKLEEIQNEQPIVYN